MEGGMHVRQLGEGMEANRIHFQKREPGQMLLDLAPDVETAREKKRQMGRKRLEARNDKADRQAAGGAVCDGGAAAADPGAGV